MEIPPTGKPTAEQRAAWSKRQEGGLGARSVPNNKVEFTIQLVQQVEHLADRFVGIGRIEQAVELGRRGPKAAG